MSTHRHIDLLCVAAVLLSLVLTVLFCCGQALGIGILSDEDDGDGQFTKNDLNADWDTAGATRITLTGTGGKVSGNGAYLIDGDVHIVYAGKYILSGELTDGSIIIDADGDDKVWLLLDGVSVHCSDGTALRVEQAKKVFLTLAAGTENTFTDGSTYSEALTERGVDGAIYSRDDLTINGSGALTVNGAYQHGIVCNDDLVITGGTIVVNAVQDGIHAHDSVRFTGAGLTVTAGDDGVTASGDEETSYLYIASGRITIPACYEGLEAVSVTIDGGAIDIVSTDDGINACGRGDGSEICINGGTIRIVNPTGRDADGLDSNGDIFINGGEIFISVNGGGGSTAIDYGSENGGICRVSGGTVVACGGSAMLEAIDPDSPQAFLMVTTSGAADTAVSLTGADGTVLLSETIPCAFSSAILSTPALRLGDSCTLTVGGTAETVVIDNSSAAGGMFGGMSGGMRGQGGRGGPGARTENEGGMPEMPDGTENREGPPEIPGGGPGEGMPDMPGGMENGEDLPEMPGGGSGEGMPEMPGGMESGEDLPEMPGSGPGEGMPGIMGNGEPVEGAPGMMPEQDNDAGGRGMPFTGGSGAEPSFDGEAAAPEALPPDGEGSDAPGSFPPDGEASDVPGSFPPDGESGDAPDGFSPDGTANGLGGFGGMGMDGATNRDGGRTDRFMGQMPGMQNAPGENAAGENIFATLPLVGVSALVLLLGLLFAAKIKGKYE